MEDTYGCNLINTKHDGRQVTEFASGEISYLRQLYRKNLYSFADYL